MHTDVGIPVLVEDALDVPYFPQILLVGIVLQVDADDLVLG